MDALKVDLHLHTADDPLDNIAHEGTALVDRAAELGFDALAVTLHDRQLANPSLGDYARDRGILLLPGVERTIGGRHIVLINFPQAAEDAASFEDIARLKAKCGGLVIAPHPFYPGRSCLGTELDALSGLVDAVEWSYFWTRATNFNARAERWARRHGKPVVGNSDLHDLRQLGRTYSWIFAERDADSICAAVREGRVSLRTRPVPVAELAQVFGGMVLRGYRPKSPRPVPLTHQPQVP